MVDSDTIIGTVFLTSVAWALVLLAVCCVWESIRRKDVALARAEADQRATQAEQALAELQRRIDNFADDNGVRD